MPSFNYESHTAKLELRVLELEDTVATLTHIVKGLNDMMGHINEMMGHYADSLGGLMLALPTVARKLPMWPVASSPASPCGAGCGCAGGLDTPSNTPQ
jgi:hypothetical protein